MKVNGKHEKLKQLRQSRFCHINPKFFDSCFFDKGNAIHLTYINFSKTLNIMPHLQAVVKQLIERAE